MKLFAHESIKSTTFIGNETFEELQEENDDISREVIEYAEAYDNAIVATSTLTTLDSMRITDRRVYDITMESINDQLGYPEGTRLTLEGIGATVGNFAKKVWDKIVKALRNFDINILKMFNMVGNLMRGTTDKAVIEILNKSREECIALVKTDNKVFLSEVGKSWDKAHAALDEKTWIASKNDIKTAFNVHAIDVVRAIDEKKTLDKPVNMVSFKFTVTDGMVAIQDGEQELKKRTIEEYLEDSGNFMKLSNGGASFTNRLVKEGNKKAQPIKDEITKIVTVMMAGAVLVNGCLTVYRNVIFSARHIIVRIKNPDKKFKEKKLGSGFVSNAGV